MATTNVDAALAELTDALSSVGPVFEGMQDLHRVNLIPEADREVVEAITDYQRRLTLMKAAQAANAALLADGYPALEVRPIPQTAYADLADQATSIAAALAKFSSNQASAMTISGAPPQPKN